MNEPVVAALSGVELHAVAQRLSTRHTGVDAIGAPYNGHLARVVYNAEMIRGRYARGLDYNDVAATSWLHDLVEDNYSSFDELNALGIPQHVLAALRLLTHHKGQTLEDYLIPLREDRLALLVKMADLRDNSDPVRLAHLANIDPERASRLVAKYTRYHELLDTAFGNRFGADVLRAVCRDR